jgi:hypothetical protein
MRSDESKARGLFRMEEVMKYLFLALGLVATAWVFAPTQASAVVCARGVYRAGCAGPNGGVAVRRYPGYYGAPRPYVAPRPVVVAPAAVCTWHWRNGVRVRICR